MRPRRRARAALAPCWRAAWTLARRFFTPVSGVVFFFFLSQGAAVIKDGGRRMFAGCGVLISGKFQPEVVLSNKHLMRRIL